MVTKPFDSYKWRWLSVQPSEGLLKAPVYLGVLRALQKHQGNPYSSEDLYNELLIVQEETNSSVTLAREPNGNLFRNSGQYWRGTGLLLNQPGEIQLSSLGRRVADGSITNDEFASLMIRNTVLPNPLTYSPLELEKWHDADLRIKPLELILNVMTELGTTYGSTYAYLTPDELIKIVIPLSGNKETSEAISRAIYQYRGQTLDISGWPDCAPAANDRRLAREFLLFLENFEICRVGAETTNNDQRFYLDNYLNVELDINLGETFFENTEITEDEIVRTAASNLPTIIERTRTTTSIVHRPNQAKFRRQVLSQGNGRCILTGESTPEVIEAAHIIPVSHGGSDDPENGFCMRVDIHRLFDGGKIRIQSDGQVTLNPRLNGTPSYTELPLQIAFPQSVNLINVEWRSRYL